jgi:hypothetical protein
VWTCGGTGKVTRHIQTRVLQVVLLLTLNLSVCFAAPMAPQQLATLYKELQRAFDARPSNLQRCGTLLAQLKVTTCRACSAHGQLLNLSRLV